MHDISGTLDQNFTQIGPHSSEISFLISESFCYFSIIVTLKLYNFYTVQGRGIQSAYEMLCMKRAFQTCIVYAAVAHHWFRPCAQICYIFKYFYKNFKFKA